MHKILDLLGTCKATTSGVDCTVCTHTMSGGRIPAKTANNKKVDIAQQYNDT